MSSAKKRSGAKAKRTYTDRITILGEGVSETQERFIKLSVKQPDGSEKETIERIDNLAGRNAKPAMYERLTRLGAHLVHGKAGGELIERIQRKGAQEASFQVVNQVG